MTARAAARGRVPPSAPVGVEFVDCNKTGVAHRVKESSAAVARRDGFFL